jgi:hypothetical protein
MWVKVPPARLRHESLSAHADQTRYLESKAGMGAQSDICCGVTLALMGSFYGENRTWKSNLHGSGGTTKNPDFTGVLNSRRAFVFGSDMSLGNPVVKLVPPNET